MNVNEKFIYYNDQLIKEVKTASPRLYEYLTDLKDHYTNDLDIIGYANVQLGLSKALDFIEINYKDNEQQERINNLIKMIVSSAIALIEYNNFL